MKTLKFLLVIKPKILLVICLAIMSMPLIAQVVDSTGSVTEVIDSILNIDWKTVTFQQALIVLLPIVTMLWGQILKLIPSIDNSGQIQKMIYIGLSAFIMIMLFTNQEFSLSTMLANVYMIFTGLAAYPMVKAGSKKLPLEFVWPIKIKEGKVNVVSAVKTSK